MRCVESSVTSKENGDCPLLCMEVALRRLSYPRSVSPMRPKLLQKKCNVVASETREQPNSESCETQEGCRTDQPIYKGGKMIGRQLNTLIGL